MTDQPKAGPSLDPADTRINSFISVTMTEFGPGSQADCSIVGFLFFGTFGQTICASRLTYSAKGAVTISNGRFLVTQLS